MSKVKDVFGIDSRRFPFPRHEKKSDLFLRNDRLLGVEIELENFTNAAAEALAEPPMVDYWSRDHDGSLRDPSVEIVLRKPMMGKSLENAINAAYDWIEAHKLRPSNRTGVHIHVDMRDRTVDEVIRICASYALFEEVLFEWAGYHRKDNLFCIAWSEAENHIRRIGQALRVANLVDSKEQVSRTWNRIVRDDIRYSALNLQSLCSHGTIEFRHLETPTNRQTMVNWINLILSLTHYGSSTEIQDQIEQASAVDPNELGEVVFGPLSQLLSRCGSWNPGGIRRSARLAQDLLVFSQREGVLADAALPEESSFAKFIDNTHKEKA